VQAGILSSYLPQPTIAMQISSPDFPQINVANLASHHGEGYQSAPHINVYLDSIRREMASTARALVAAKQSHDWGAVKSWAESLTNLKAEYYNAKSQSQRER
jgi:hypothetical protein